MLRIIIALLIGIAVASETGYITGICISLGVAYIFHNEYRTEVTNKALKLIKKYFTE